MKKSRVTKIILKYSYSYVIILFLLFILNILALITPQIIGYTTDSLLSDSSADISRIQQIFVNFLGGKESILDNLWLIGFFLIFIAGIIAIVSFIKGRESAKLSQSIAQDLRDDLFEHLLDLPYSYFNKINTGDIIQRCTSDINSLCGFLSGQLIEIVRIITLIIISLTYMISINVQLSIYSTFILPFSFLFGLLFVKLFGTTFKNFEEKEGEISRYIQENVSGVRVVKAFNNEQYEIEKFTEVNQTFNLALRKLLRAFATFWSVSDLLCLIQYAIAIIAGAYFGYKGDITAGEYVIFISYSAMLIWPVRQLGRILSDFGKTKVAYRRLKEIFDTPKEPDLIGGETPDINGDIIFKDFSFKFEDEDKYYLKNINLHIKKGETIGILGSIGSGKSTLMHLLLRLHPYSEGSIKINNVELNSINKNHLRNNIGMALQDNFLYGKTIIENLKLANPSISDEEVFDVTKVANIHHTFTNFSDGYKTQVGERGVTLSGGQKQRAIIARTLIKKASILIFDDSLSAVDPETDLKIREELQNINKNITTIIIAQRINTIMECDKIIVMDKGAITNIGTHDQLIQEEGIYKDVWDIQNMQSED